MCTRMDADRANNWSEKIDETRPIVGRLLLLGGREKHASSQLVLDYALCAWRKAEEERKEMAMQELTAEIHLAGKMKRAWYFFELTEQSYTGIL